MILNTIKHDINFKIEFYFKLATEINFKIEFYFKLATEIMLTALNNVIVLWAAWLWTIYEYVNSQWFRKVYIV